MFSRVHTLARIRVVTFGLNIPELYYIFFTTFSGTGSIVPFLRQSSSGSHTSPDMRAVSIMPPGSPESVRPSLLEKGFVSAHEKRFLKPIIDELLGLNHPAPIAPAQLNVDLAQLIRGDCKHPIAANYRQTMKSLNVDLKEFMVYDPQVGGHPEVKLGNIMEVTMGTIVDGVCAGDFIYTVNTYIPTDANACSSGALKSLNVTQMQVTITGWDKQG
ncbi:unnamed protein product [Oppiella nova]|uniref:Uncharacterized protein n=1 Tax=Oppiella nova TaxID=334625 RepID=A0A7R9LSL3_9ACAR|nr:unnamed protein product [Oppiella nova]CAG2166544.1 unnamed protein product [Oppiella nova]